MQALILAEGNAHHSVESCVAASCTGCVLAGEACKLNMQPGWVQVPASALMASCQYGHLSVLTAFIAHGSSVNEIDGMVRHTSPVHMQCKLCSTSVVAKRVSDMMNVIHAGHEFTSSRS